MAKVKILRKREFTPKWDNNAKKEQPVVITLRYLTPGEIDETMELKYVESAVNAKNPTGLVIEHDDKSMVKWSVVGIEHLMVEDETGETTQIKNGQDIIDTPGLEGLFYECLGEIKSMNSRIDSKN